MSNATTRSASRPGTATGETSLSPAPARAAAPSRQVQGSVFVTGQVWSRDQRRGRYTPQSLTHPGKMLPSIARYLIATYTQVGQWVWGSPRSVEASAIRRSRARDTQEVRSGVR